MLKKFIAIKKIIAPMLVAVMLLSLLVSCNVEQSEFIAALSNATNIEFNIGYVDEETVISSPSALQTSSDQAKALVKVALTPTQNRIQDQTLLGALVNKENKIGYWINGANLAPSPSLSEGEINSINAALRTYIETTFNTLLNIENPENIDKKADNPLGKTAEEQALSQQCILGNAIYKVLPSQTETGEAINPHTSHLTRAQALIGLTGAVHGTVGGTPIFPLPATDDGIRQLNQNKTIINQALQSAVKQGTIKENSAEYNIIINNIPTLAYADQYSYLSVLDKEIGITLLNREITQGEFVYILFNMLQAEGYSELSLITDDKTPTEHQSNLQTFQAKLQTSRTEPVAMAEPIIAEYSKNKKGKDGIEGYKVKTMGEILEQVQKRYKLDIETTGLNGIIPPQTLSTIRSEYIPNASKTVETNLYNAYMTIRYNTVLLHQIDIAPTETTGINATLTPNDFYKYLTNAGGMMRGLGLSVRDLDETPDGTAESIDPSAEIAITHHCDIDDTIESWLAGPGKGAEAGTAGAYTKTHLYKLMRDLGYTSEMITASKCNNPEIAEYLVYLADPDGYMAEHPLTAPEKEPAEGTKPKKELTPEEKLDASTKLFAELDKQFEETDKAMGGSIFTGECDGKGDDVSDEEMRALVKKYGDIF